MSDEWFNAACWSSLVLEIFIIKMCVVLRLTYLGNLK